MEITDLVQLPFAFAAAAAAAAAAAKSLQLCLTLRPHRWQPARLRCPWDSPYRWHNIILCA